MLRRVHKARYPKRAAASKARHAREVAAYGKSLFHRGTAAYRARMVETDSPEHAIRTSYGKLKEKPFSLEEALEMTLFEYAVKTMDYRKYIIQRDNGNLSGFVLDALYPDYVCALCNNEANCFHHITRNRRFHGKGRVLWIIPLCRKCHSILHHHPIGQTELDLYEIVLLKHMLPEGLEFNFRATKNITFEDALFLAAEKYEPTDQIAQLCGASFNKNF